MIITLLTKICMVFVGALLMFDTTIGDFNGCAISIKSIEVKQTYHNYYIIMYFDFGHLTRHTNFSFEFSLTL